MVFFLSFSLSYARTSFRQLYGRDPTRTNPQTKRISEERYRPVGRLFASRYCTTRQVFDLPGELPNGESVPAC
jgi:hypothetical protein